MKWLDYYIQRKRFKMAARFISPKSTLLDIGCNQGEFFSYLTDREISGTGIDPIAVKDSIDLNQNIKIIRSAFPPENLMNQRFDNISALAVLEHIPAENLEPFARACYQLLSHGGKLIITVPSPLVDTILVVLKKLKMIDGMALEEHHGYSPGDTQPLFRNAGFTLKKHKKFLFGLNNIFVFVKENNDDL